MAERRVNVPRLCRAGGEYRPKTAAVAVVGRRANLGREPINLPGGRFARVRYAPIAIKFRSAAKWRDVPNADINCRDCVVRSLAGPEPDRQVFAKFKHLSARPPRARPKTIYVTIGEILEHLRPPNAPLAMPNP